RLYPFVFGGAIGNRVFAIGATFVNRHSSSCVVGKPLASKYSPARLRTSSNPEIAAIVIARSPRAPRSPRSRSLRAIERDPYPLISQSALRPEHEHNPERCDSRAAGN